MCSSREYLRIRVFLPFYQGNKTISIYDLIMSSRNINNRTDELSWGHNLLIIFHKML